MSDGLKLFLGIMIPFFGTSAGAAMVFLLKNQMNDKVSKFLLGFASGVMIAASIWSLIMPALDMAEDQGVVPWIPAAVGFLLGMFFLLALDNLVPHMHQVSETEEGPDSNLKKSTKLMFAVTMHNIPEGMAVGVILAGLLSGQTNISWAAAFVLATGIAIQNFPEGAIISMPLVGEGFSRKKAFGMGVASGVVEPIAAIITVLMTSWITPILPYLLTFAAGAMIYVVVEELIPDSQIGEHSNIGTIGVALGFTLMMVLDVALG